MGSKFCNLNVYGADLAVVEALCPGYSVRALTTAWITAAGEDLQWGTAQKAARRLSRSLPSPVLSTEYFDDDYVEFSLYREGKRVARHVPAEYEGFARTPGKSKVWAEQLGLSPEAEKNLRIVFKETNPEASLRLLACVIGCPLWVDTACMDEAAVPQQAYLTEYLARKNAERKLKNQTKLTLLDEVLGDFGWHPLYPAVQVQHTDGMKSFWDIQDGHFRRLFQKAVPGQAEGCRAQARGEDAFLLTFMEFDTQACQETAYVFSDHGEVLEEIYGGGQCLLKGAFLDRDRVFLDGGCWNIRTHKKEWDLGLGKTAYGIHPPCRLTDGRLAIVYDTPESPLSSFLVSFRPDGSDPLVLKLPEYRHWTYPLACGAGLYLGCGKRIICYNGSLEEQWNIELEENVGQLGTPYLDAEAQMLYMSTYRRITAFDLRTRRITAVRENADGEDRYLYGILPGVGPIILTGDSSIQVWNSDLAPISRHRVKGAVRQVLHLDGSVYLLANVSEDHTVRKTEAGWESVLTRQGCLRLYELRS